MRTRSLTKLTTTIKIGRAALLALIALAAIGIWGGCNGDSTAPLPRQESGLVVVGEMGIGTPVRTSEGEFSVLTFPVWFGDQQRQVELRASADEWVATILDQDVLGFELHWRSDGTGWEQTAFERLDIAILEEGSAEVYEYTDLLTGSTSSMVATTSTTLEEWAAFFDPHTLNNNVEGERLAAVLTTPLVVETLAPYCDPGSGVEKKMSSTERLCYVASTLGTLKCILGFGVANPLCHVAMGVSFCCGVMVLANGELD